MKIFNSAGGSCIYYKAKSSGAVNTEAVLSKFCDNSVVVNNPTFAYNIIIFIDRTSTYTITFTHHYEGRLGSGIGLV